MHSRPYRTAGALAILAVLLIAWGRYGPVIAQQPGPNPQDPGAVLAPSGLQPSSAFTYQGQLRKNGAPVNGSCNTSFSLWDEASGGAQIGGTVTSATLGVKNGLFTIALDFGWGAFSGEARWLQTAVGCGEVQVTLVPRTALHPAPYAFALPGMRTFPGNPANYAGPSMNVVGGLLGEASGNVVATNTHNSAISGGSGNRVEPYVVATGVEDEYAYRCGDFATHSVIAGGADNVIGGLGIDWGWWYWDCVSSSRANSIGGGAENSITGTGVTYNSIGGGYSNRIEGDYAFTHYNVYNNRANVIGGGRTNRMLIEGSESNMIGGGADNAITGTNAQGVVVAGGVGNRVAADGLASGGHFIGGAVGSVIGGGGDNYIHGDDEFGSSYATIAGGRSNQIKRGQNNWSAQYSTIPGGYRNLAAAPYAFAAGTEAKAIHQGAFVWADGPEYESFEYTNPLTSTAQNQFLIRASGGVTMFTNSNATVGARLPAGSGSWVSLSDRAMKANVARADPRAVLEAVVSLPVSTWNYTSQDASIRHIGPMAQDFYAAFGVGESDTGISTVDAQGVALAAIQGLKAENDELRARLDRLEQERGNSQVGLWAFALGVVVLGGVLAVRRR